MKGFLNKQITHGGWIKMTLIGTMISVVIMIVEFIWMGIIKLPFKKTNKNDNED